MSNACWRQPQAIRIISTQAERDGPATVYWFVAGMGWGRNESRNETNAHERERIYASVQMWYKFQTGRGDKIGKQREARKKKWKSHTQQRAKTEKRETSEYEGTSKKKEHSQ